MERSRGLGLQLRICRSDRNISRLLHPALERSYGYRLYTGARSAPASIALRADVASGDHDKSGPNLQTFSPLFPTGFYFNQAILKTVRSTKWVFIQTSRSTWTKALRSMANGVGSGAKVRLMASMDSRQI
jgi:hypothetical protein